MNTSRRAEYWRIKKVSEASGFMVQEEYQHQGLAENLLAQANTFFVDNDVQFKTGYTAGAYQVVQQFY